MRLVSICFSLLAVVLMVSACTPAVEETPEIDLAAEESAAREAMEDSGKRWDSAMEAGDAEALAGFFTEDAIKMDSDAPTIIGKAAIRSSMETYLEGNTVQAESTIDEVRLAGDWLVARGTFREILTPEGDGEPIEIVGKFMEINERQADGSWKVSRSIWNRDHALPAPSD
jgi:uncharacterized protein (TIGR02246 family)